MVKEWTEALDPYGPQDNSLSYIFMAASHGAVEALAEQWRIRNLACALRLRNQRTHKLQEQGDCRASVSSEPAGSEPEAERTVRQSGA